jgi:hypothetical protein
MMPLTEIELELRRGYVCGTDAKRIADGDWPALWREKTGRAEPVDLSGILAVQMGSFTEPFNRQWFEKMTGRSVTNISGWQEIDRRVIGDTGASSLPMGCNLDGITKTSRGYGAVWDAKHVGRADDTAVMRYTPQMTHNCTVCGLDWWVISFFIGNSKWEVVEQEVDPLYQAELLAKEAEFWRYVELDEEPPDMTPVVAPKPVPMLRKIDLTDRLDRYNWSPDIVREIVTFADTDGAAKAHAIARQKIGELLPDDVGELRLGLFKLKRNKAGALTMTLEKPR